MWFALSLLGAVLYLVGYFMGGHMERKLYQVLLADAERDRDRLAIENAELSRKLRIALGGTE